FEFLHRGKMTRKQDPDTLFFQRRLVIEGLPQSFRESTFTTFPFTCTSSPGRLADEFAFKWNSSCK
ncbi:hypothetical protein O5833_27510, partial [Escherichia coli]|nr:hypothetical protein [Escherichia coli]